MPKVANLVPVLSPPVETDPGPTTMPGGGTCVYRAFEHYALTTPDSVALVCGEESFTYGELNSRANALAYKLKESGIRPDNLVVVALNRSARFVISVLAIHKAGGAYLPVDPQLPPERIAFMIQDSATPILLSEESVLQRISLSGCQVFSFDHFKQCSGSPENPEPVAKGTHLAYVLYTSGSTGQPKGVMIEHRSVANLFRSTSRLLGADPDSVWLASSNFSFDISIQEFLWPLCHGLKVVIFRGDESGESIPQLILKHGITHVQGTPSRANLLLEEPETPAALRQLRQLLLAGEALAPDLAARLHAHLGGELYNLYGPTETTIYSTGCKVLKGANPVPIGRAMANTELLVVDAEMRRVGPGEMGELLIGGEGLARGYLGRPQLTAERFVPHPSSPATRVYRTGDLVRERNDGQLDYLGRLDHQVKIRGYRIELGEIESRLRELPEILEAAVLAVDRPDQTKELVAYITQRGVPAPKYGNIRCHLKSHLPEYSIPARFVVLPGMPLTPSKKIDRRALASASGIILEPAIETSTPRDEVEEQLSRLWCEVLGLKQVGLQDRFADVGGHSLLALKLVSKLNRELKLRLPWSVVFAHPTIATLADAIRVATGRTVAKPELEPLPKASGPEAPASSAQQQMWVMHEASVDKATYIVSFAFRLQGQVDLAALESACRGLIERHDILRTEFFEVAGELRQRIVPLTGPFLEIVTPVDGSANGTPPPLQEQLRAAVRKPFDMRRAPLWRLQLFQAGNQDSFLVWSAHHAIVDEEAVRLIFQELTVLYQRASGGPQRPLPELKARYADFAEWEKKQNLLPCAEEHREFWRKQLDEAPWELALPTDHPRPSEGIAKGGQKEAAFSIELSQELIRLGREEGCSPFLVGLAAYYVLLARLTGQTDIVIGTPVSGRHREEFQTLVGLFLNSIPVRCRTSPGNTFRQVLAEVRKAAIEGLDHAVLPTLEIARALGRMPRGGGAPLYRTMFVLVEEPRTPLSIPGIKSDFVAIHTGTAKFDLSLSVAISRTGQWRSYLEYARDLFTTETAERILGYWEALLKGLVTRPNDPIEEVALVGAEEEQRLLEWGAGPRVAVPEKRLEKLIEAQVARSPEATAVVAGKTQWTYQELNARANQLAGFFRHHGVKRGDRVALCLSRTVVLPATLLGVLKASAAYVLLDPDLPADRLAFLLSDCRPTLLLTEQALLDRVRAASETKVLVLEKEAAEIECLPIANPTTENLPDDVAYLIYTSGSTGEPKGAEIPHRAITNYTVWRQTQFPLNSSDVIFQKTAFSFDASVWEFWSPLAAGARLVIGEDVKFRDPFYLISTIRQQGVTQLQVVPSMLRALSEQPDFGACTSLRRVYCGGEILSADTIRRFRQQLPSTPLVNLYGPAEVTIDATVWECPAAWNSTALLGKPVSNTYAYVVDSRLHLAPTGVVGELCLGGPQVARGYFNRESLSRERFVPDPWNRNDGSGRLYRSGDRVRWRPDGNLEFLGRADDQLKIRGQRIEPSEVEAALVSHELVQEVAVLGRTNRGEDKELVAVIVPVAGNTPTVAQLREHLRHQLPDGMIPSRWEILPQLPLTANGKVDKRRLEAQPAALLTTPEPEAIPQTGTELALLRLWRETLGRDDLTLHDEFFASGGHSLLAMKLVSLVRRSFGVEVTLLDLFAHPTVFKLAGWIAAHDRTSRRRSRVALRGQGKAVPLFHVPGFHGFEFLPRKFRDALGEHRLYFDGLQYPGLDGHDTALSSVESIASALNAQLTEIWPEGPLCLSGMSGGGKVALEMASQLREAGRVVEVVLLYDSWSPLGGNRRSWIGALQAAVRRYKTIDPSQRGALLRAIAQNRARALWRRIVPAKASAVAAAAAADQSLSPRARVATASFHALGGHMPRQYPGRVVLFKAQDETSDHWIRFAPDAINGWGPFCKGDFSVRHVPGKHLTLFKEPALSAVIEETLRALGHLPERKP